MSRKKGSTYERECAERMRELGYLGAKRHLEVQKEEANGVDLDGTSPFVVQCKHTAGGYNPLRALSEIKRPGHKVAFVKQTGKGEYVAMSWETFAVLVGAFRALNIPRNEIEHDAD